MLPVLSMGKLFGLRSVCHLRETIKLTRAERLAFPHVDMFVTLTDEGRRFYSDQGLPEDRMRRVYDAVDSSIIVRDGCAKDPQLFTMGIIGALIPRKGHRYLLEAMAAQPASGPRIRLLIAGEGPVARELQTKCVVLGLQKQVEFLGYVDDVGAVLSRIDALVVPSLQEGFSQVVLEAMTAGLPVIASALPGLDELVEEGRTGFLVPPANADALRRTIHKLASDPGLASELGRAARVRIDAGLFNPEREAEEIATVIHEAAARV
jgi:glycosyltransferase involved in cell wall biosynthesis